MRRRHHRLRVIATGTLLWGAGMTGCAHRVQVEIPASPAVAIHADKVAVVADRQCRDVGDALVSAVNSMGGFTVDPRAEVRIQVVECGRTVDANVDVRLDEDSERRRVTFEGRAHALLVVYNAGEPQAHLVGSARSYDPGTWGDLDLFGRGRALDRSLTDALAADLTRQLSPMPTLAQRRIHPRAPEGTARRMQTDAVLAELEGDLLRARRLAAQAFEVHPTPRTAAYIEELDARLQARGLDARD